MFEMFLVLVPGAVRGPFWCAAREDEEGDQAGEETRETMCSESLCDPNSPSHSLTHYISLPHNHSLTITPSQSLSLTHTLSAAVLSEGVHM